MWSPLLAAECQRATSAGSVTVEPAARDALLEWLASRWSAVMHATAGGDVGSAEQTLHDHDALARRLSALPELDRLLLLVREQWRASVRELWARLEGDRARLSGVLFAGAPLERVVGLQAGLSDPHGGGRSVVILTLAGDRRVVYKPRDLRVGVWFMRLCVELGERLPWPIPGRAMLARDGYGWEQWMQPAPCASEAAVRRYFARAGGLLRLLEVLGGADFHRDNVLACGEHPVLLDLETVLDALPPSPAGATTAEQRAFELRKESVLRVGLLPEWALAAAGAEPFDHGGLAVAPLLDGAPVERSRYLQDVVDGYTQTAAALGEAHTRAVLAGALREATDLPLRYVHRPTPVYLQLRRDSLAPERLAMPGGREAFLRDALGDDAIARAETNALLRLDVPLFCCTLERRGVRELGDRVDGWHRAGASGYRDIDVTWLDPQRGARVLARATRASDPDLIVSAFAAGPVRASVRLPQQVVTAAGRDELVCSAIAIGDLVLGAAIEAAGPALAWLGLRVDPQSGLRGLERLPPDVLSGTSGIAIVLARLYAVTGERRFAVGARRALQPSLRRLELHAAGGDAGSARESELDVLHGRGAWLYACEQCAVHLGQRDLRPERAGHPLAGSAAAIAAAPGDPLDQLENVLVAFERTGDRALEREAARLAASFIARRAACGSWLAPEAGADRHNLSAIGGVCALADSFLRLAEPGRFGSIRLGR